MHVLTSAVLILLRFALRCILQLAALPIALLSTMALFGTLPYKVSPAPFGTVFYTILAVTVSPIWVRRVPFRLRVRVLVVGLLITLVPLALLMPAFALRHEDVGFDITDFLIDSGVLVGLIVPLGMLRSARARFHG